VKCICALGCFGVQISSLSLAQRRETIADERAGKVSWANAMSAFCLSAFCLSFVINRAPGLFLTMYVPVLRWNGSNQPSKGRTTARCTSCCARLALASPPLIIKPTLAEFSYTSVMLIHGLALDSFSSPSCLDFRACIFRMHTHVEDVEDGTALELEVGWGRLVCTRQPEDHLVCTHASLACECTPES
jgi:hypothetical protein